MIARSDTMNYADKLNGAILKKGNPCIVGLDPRLEQMPAFTRASYAGKEERLDEAVRASIGAYHRLILDTVCDLVPGVKLQSAFYEQYGVGGLLALQDTIAYAKKKGLVVIIDAKRNDIASTAEAYANAFLGKTKIFGIDKPILDVDCITVSPYLGKDSIQPFVETCKMYGKGIFILVKTSNPGSVDLQDLRLKDGNVLYNKAAEIVNQFSGELMGESGYSSIGAVVGATFPEDAKLLRKLMPKSIFLVPGYGSQGGAAKNTAYCFNKDGLGAVINASRSITYPQGIGGMSEDQTRAEIRKLTDTMIKDVLAVLERK